MTRPVVTIVYNTCVYVVKFRLPLIAALQDAGYDVVVIAPRDDATQTLIDLGIAHRHIDMSQYGMNPVAEIATLRQIETLLRELRPVASLHYTIKPNTFGSIAANRAGVPVLNNIAGAGRAFSGGNPAMRALVVRLYRWGLKRSHTVLFQNGDDMALFLRAGAVRKDQCARIPGSGVDLKAFVPTPLPDGPVRFLFVGRLLREKGIEEFLRAAAHLIAAAPEGHVQFDVVGEFEPGRAGLDRATLDRLTEPAEISYHGTVKPDAIKPMMRRASCVVLPSYYGEGVPRVLLEACASGRPIITTDNVGCRDVVEPGVNGWMVAPRDTAALADAMQAFVDAPRDQRDALAKAARQTAETRFDEKIVLAAYLDRLRALAPVETV